MINPLFKKYQVNLLLVICLISFTNNTIQAQSSSHHYWATGAWYGQNGYGSILKSDSTGHQFTQVASFNYFNGSYPLGDIVMAGEGKIYGVCNKGGTNNSCTLYVLDTSKQLITKLHDFALNYTDGDVPESGVILASDCKLCGTTHVGGKDSVGVIFCYDIAKNQYTDIYDFIDSTGSTPDGQLTQLSDGKIYGTTQRGGKFQVGTIYNFDPVTHVYTVLYHFNNSTGSYPFFGKIIQAPDGNIYGTTYKGGSNNGGVLYRFNPVAKTYTVLYNFSYYSSIGGSPMGKVAYVNGKIYGMTRGNNPYYGVIYSYDLSADTLVVLLSFNKSNGANPIRGLNLSTSGKLFGTTAEGGVHNLGVIFNFDPFTNTYEKILDFDSLLTGGHPDCDVMEMGPAPNLCATVSTDENYLIDFSIFPNPSHSDFTIHLSRFAYANSSSIKVLDALGNIILSKDLRTVNTIIETINWPSGIYFLRIESGNEMATKKLIKD